MDTWRKMVSVSVRDIRKTFDRLHVSFDYWYGESDSSKYVPQLLQILSEKICSFPVKVHRLWMFPVKVIRLLFRLPLS